jgi:Cu(I)/Ag(I) efflux system membrane fusion protein/cobalt-zinc-cadmium efflux system membrane fusion protein
MRKLIILTLLVLASGCSDKTPTKMDTEASSVKGEKKIVFYRSPMDPSYISKKPGKDGMGMDLVAVYEGDPSANLDVIKVKGATIQKMGIRVDTVKAGRLSRVVRALGQIEFDEPKVSKVNMKFDGWIEKLWVDETGQFVKKGDPLFSVYSPELVASEEEYLSILKKKMSGPHSAHFLRASKERLLQFDVPKSFIKNLEKTGKVSRTTIVRAPRSGYVVHKSAFVGTEFKKGANLFTLAELDALWIIADVFERDASWVKKGQTASIELDYMPGSLKEAKVDYIYPVLNRKNRTIKIRLILPNPDVILKPGMFATVRIHTKPIKESILVLSEAVIHSGERNIAFVYKGDGLFEPRELKLGVKGDEKYQVLSGLEIGEKVVTSGQFLLDSESRLKEAVKKMLGSNIEETK